MTLEEEEEVGGGGAAAWIDLTDTPAAIEATKFVVGDAGGVALEFAGGVAGEFTLSTVEMAGWEELDHITLTGTAANLDFQNISQDYKDLKLTFKLRTDRISASENIFLYFNNDSTAANYYWQLLYGRDAAAGAQEGDSHVITTTPADSSPADYFGFGHIIVRRYTEAELHHAYAVSVARRTSTQQENTINSVHWEIANAVTCITLTPQTGTNFVAGSEVILYGLRKRDVVVGVSGQVTINHNVIVCHEDAVVCHNDNVVTN